MLAFARIIGRNCRAAAASSASVIAASGTTAMKPSRSASRASCSRRAWSASWRASSVAERRRMDQSDGDTSPYMRSSGTREPPVKDGKDRSIGQDRSMGDGRRTGDGRSMGDDRSTGACTSTGAGTSRGAGTSTGSSGADSSRAISLTIASKSLSVWLARTAGTRCATVAPDPVASHWLSSRCSAAVISLRRSASWPAIASSTRRRAAKYSARTHCRSVESRIAAWSMVLAGRGVICPNGTVCRV